MSSTLVVREGGEQKAAVLAISIALSTVITLLPRGSSCYLRDLPPVSCVSLPCYVFEIQLMFSSITNVLEKKYIFQVLNKIIAIEE